MCFWMFMWKEICFCWLFLLFLKNLLRQSRKLRGIGLNQQTSRCRNFNFYKTCKQSKGKTVFKKSIKTDQRSGFFQETILGILTLKTEHGFVELLELETQVSHLLVRYWTTKYKRRFLSQLIFLKKNPNRVSWISRPGKKCLIECYSSLQNSGAKVCHSV